MGKPVPINPRQAETHHLIVTKFQPSGQAENSAQAKIIFVLRALGFFWSPGQQNGGPKDFKDLILESKPKAALHAMAMRN